MLVLPSVLQVWRSFLERVQRKWVVLLGAALAPSLPLLLRRSGNGLLLPSWPNLVWDQVWLEDISQRLLLRQFWRWVLGLRVSAFVPALVASRV